MGSLDLGGASAEIAFQAVPSESPHYLTNVTIYDRSYTLYARSYLCYGLNEARLRFLAHLIHVRPLHTHTHPYVSTVNEMQSSKLSVTLTVNGSSFV